MNHEINKLLEIMASLRDPQSGCPWDQQQSFESLTTYTIEEAYEVADAVVQKDWNQLKSELGDLLFQVVFYSQIGKERELFDLKDVIESLNDKMIRRHPHVFSNQSPVKDAEHQSQLWEQRKNQSRQSVLDDIPKTFTALLKAVKLTKRAAVIGFDWPEIDFVFDKIQEELTELKEAIESKDPYQIKDELGDVLFVCTNLARHLKIDPELALIHANKKFETRFRQVELQAKSKHPNIEKFDLDLLESLWLRIKAEEI
jgi:MazG family protein